MRHFNAASIESELPIPWIKTVCINFNFSFQLPMTSKGKLWEITKNHANPKPNTLWSVLFVMKGGQILVKVIVIMQLHRTGFIYTAQIKLHTGDFVICDRMSSTQKVIQIV
jgi:hypothetical protein